MDQNNQFDMSRLLEQADQLRQNTARMREEILASGAQGTAGGGLVKVTVDGRGAIETLEISPVAVDPGNAQGLADMIVSAVQDAHAALTKIQEAHLNPLLEGLNALEGGIS
ncbi:YbaB/EbfC family nucleoid-associated protein [Streptomyces sp. NPDC005122]